MTKVANLLSAKAEIGAPMICMYLLENPDHYTSHSFVPFYWQSYVGEVRRAFEEASEEQQPKMTLIKKKGKIMGLSPIQDYVHRAPELEYVSLYEWIRCYKRERLRLRKKRCTGTLLEDTSTANADPEEDVESRDASFQSVKQVEMGVNDGPSTTNVNHKYKNLYRFAKEHSLHETHAMHFVLDNMLCIPNFAGANLPRCDQGDRVYYCCSMLTIFKPWQNGLDLKQSQTVTWDDEFTSHVFNDSELAIMKNLNIRYECLDAQDDF